MSTLLWMSMLKCASLASGRSQSMVMCGMTWRDRKQEKMTMPLWSGLPLRNSSPDLVPQTFTEGWSVLPSKLQLWSCTRELCLHTRLFGDRFRKKSKLCSNWIPCKTEVPWACLQCHPVGTGRAVLVLLGNAPWKTPLPAVVHWGVSDAIKHRAWEMKSPRKMWATLHLVLANKIGHLEE